MLFWFMCIREHKLKFKRQCITSFIVHFMIIWYFAHHFSSGTNQFDFCWFTHLTSQHQIFSLWSLTLIMVSQLLASWKTFQALKHSLSCNWKGSLPSLPPTYSTATKSSICNKGLIWLCFHLEFFTHIT